MIDWQLVVLRIKRVFHMTDEELAAKVGGSPEQISGLKRGLVKEPRYTLAVELLKLKGKADLSPQPKEHGMIERRKEERRKQDIGTRCCKRGLVDRRGGKNERTAEHEFLGGMLHFERII